MSTTARDLLSASLRILGVLASGEAPQASEATDGLASLNSLINSWSTENLLIPNKVREVFSLVQGQGTYTMGTGGDFNTSRPIALENALIQTGSGTSTLELPLSVLNKDQFASLSLKAMQSTYPEAVYSDGAYPLTSLNFWPVPSSANSVVLYSWKPLSELAGLSTVLSLPPGYERALKYALALELAAEYGKALREDVIELAAQSKAEIKRANSRPHFLRVDRALSSRSSHFNWITGEPT